MSIEPTCNFCNASDKFRCKTLEEAERCSTYQEKQRIFSVPSGPLKAQTEPNGDVSVFNLEGKLIIRLSEQEIEQWMDALQKFIKP